MHAATDIKTALHQLAEQLPSSATWKDVAYEAFVREQIERGLEQARQGQFASDADVAATFARWGVQIED